jgi:hypothetical protein
MFRYLLTVFLLLVFTKLVGQTQPQNCTTVTNPTLIFNNVWNEYINFSNPTTPSVSYVGNTKSSLSIGNNFFYTPASIEATPTGGSINVPATAYKICSNIELPTQDGNITAIYSLRRNFIKGFYKITLLATGSNTNVLFMYGNGAIPAISLSNALGYSSNPNVGNMNNLYNNTQTPLEKIVYLEGDVNFLIRGRGELRAFSKISTQPYNSFNCVIVPLSAPEQTCEQYKAIVDKVKSTCGLGNINVEVLDSESSYLFFYKKSSSAIYQIYPDVLKPNRDRKITIPYIEYDIENEGTTIPFWGVIRSSDGCTFYEENNPIIFEDTRFKINTSGSGITMVSAEQCGSQTGKLKIPIMPLNTTGQLKFGSYEVVLSGTINTTPSFIRTVVELLPPTSATNPIEPLIIANIPLNFVVNKINIKHTETLCHIKEVSGLNLSFQATALPSLTINTVKNPITCNTTLTLAGIDNFPCGKIVWYKREMAALQDEQIATSRSITVAPLINTTYKAKFYLYDQVFETNPFPMNAVIAPAIYDIVFSSNPFVTNNTASLDMSPITNVNVTLPIPTPIPTPPVCSCQYEIKNSSNAVILSMPVCNPSVSGLAPGSYTVSLKLSYENCEVETSKNLQVIDPLNPGTITQAVMPLGAYATMNTLLDEAYFILNAGNSNNETILKFQYNQQYQPLTSSKIKAKLYNWERRLVAFTEVNRAYGVQWYDMTLSNNIFIPGTYILELTDDNGWIQNIRVKNIVNKPLTCSKISPYSGTYCMSGNHTGFTLQNIQGSQAPYQVKCELYDDSNPRILIEEKSITAQTNTCTYIPNLNLVIPYHNYIVKMTVTDFCGNTCESTTKTINMIPCVVPIAPKPVEEVPKVEIRINVLPQNPTNPATPIIKD